MTATTHLAMGKRIALSVLIASIAPSIVAQNNCDNECAPLLKFDDLCTTD